MPQETFIGALANGRTAVRGVLDVKLHWKTFMASHNSKYMREPPLLHALVRCAHLPASKRLRVVKAVLTATGGLDALLPRYQAAALTAFLEVGACDVLQLLLRRRGGLRLERGSALGAAFVRTSPVLLALALARPGDDASVDLSLEAVELVIAAGASVLSVPLAAADWDEGRSAARLPTGSAIHEAALTGRRRTAKALMQAGARPAYAPGSTLPPVVGAARAGNLGMVKLLLPLSAGHLRPESATAHELLLGAALSWDEDLVKVVLAGRAPSGTGAPLVSVHAKSQAGNSVLADVLRAHASGTPPPNARRAPADVPVGDREAVLTLLLKAGASVWGPLGPPTATAATTHTAPVAGLGREVGERGTTGQAIVTAAAGAGRPGAPQRGLGGEEGAPGFPDSDAALAIALTSPSVPGELGAVLLGSTGVMQAPHLAQWLPQLVSAALEHPTPLPLLQALQHVPGGSVALRAALVGEGRLPQLHPDGGAAVGLQLGGRPSELCAWLQKQYDIDLAGQLGAGQVGAAVAAALWLARDTCDDGARAALVAEAGALVALVGPDGLDQGQGALREGTSPVAAAVAGGQHTLLRAILDKGASPLENEVGDCRHGLFAMAPGTDEDTQRQVVGVFATALGGGGEPSDDVLIAAAGSGMGGAAFADVLALRAAWPPAGCAQALTSALAREAPTPAVLEALVPSVGAEGAEAALTRLAQAAPPSAVAALQAALAAVADAAKVRALGTLARREDWASHAALGTLARGVDCQAPEADDTVEALLKVGLCGGQCSGAAAGQLGRNAVALRASFPPSSACLALACELPDKAGAATLNALLKEPHRLQLLERSSVPWACLQDAFVTAARHGRVACLAVLLKAGVARLLRPKGRDARPSAEVRAMMGATLDAVLGGEGGRPFGSRFTVLRLLLEQGGMDPLGAMAAMTVSLRRAVLLARDHGDSSAVTMLLQRCNGVTPALWRHVLRAALACNSDVVSAVVLRVAQGDVVAVSAGGEGDVDVLEDAVTWQAPLRALRSLIKAGFETTALVAGAAATPILARARGKGWRDGPLEVLAAEGALAGADVTLHSALRVLRTAPDSRERKRALAPVLGRSGRGLSPTPLHVAAAEGLVQFATAYLERQDGDRVDAELKDRDEHGESPLSLAVRRGTRALVQLLLRTGDIELLGSETHPCPSLHALRWDDAAVVKELLTGELRLAKVKRAALLRAAAGEDAVGVVRCVLAHWGVHATARQATAAAAEKQEAIQATEALHSAAEAGAWHAALALSEHDKGALTEQRAADKNTPLHLAVKSGSLGLLRALVYLRQGVQWDVENGAKRTPLHIAAELPTLAEPVLQCLLGSNALAIKPVELEGGKLLEGTVRTHSKNTALHLAAKAGNAGALAFLLTGHAGAKKCRAMTAEENNAGMRPLQLAVQADCAGVVRSLLDYLPEGMTVKQALRLRTGEGKSLLHLAVLAGARASVHVLHAAAAQDGGGVEAGDAYVQERDGTGLAALHVVAAYGADAKAAQVTQALLAKGAKPWDQDGQGRSALELAVASASSEPVLRALRHAVNLREANDAVVTDLLCTAVQCDHAHALEALLAMGASGGVELGARGSGRRLLHLAAEHDSVGVMYALKRWKEEVDPVERSSGFTPLHIAARLKHVRSVKELLALGASVEARDRRLRTPLHWVAHNGVNVQRLREDGPAIVSALLLAGADPHTPDLGSSTPLTATSSLLAERAFAQVEKVSTMRLLAGAVFEVGLHFLDIALDVALVGTFVLDGHPDFAALVVASLVLVSVFSAWGDGWSAYAAQPKPDEDQDEHVRWTWAWWAYGCCGPVVEVPKEKEEKAAGAPPPVPPPAAAEMSVVVDTGTERGEGTTEEGAGRGTEKQDLHRCVCHVELQSYACAAGHCCGARGCSMTDRSPAVQAVLAGLQLTPLVEFAALAHAWKHGKEVVPLTARVRAIRVAEVVWEAAPQSVLQAYVILLSLEEGRGVDLLQFLSVASAVGSLVVFFLLGVEVSVAGVTMPQLAAVALVRTLLVTGRVLSLIIVAWMTRALAGVFVLLAAEVLLVFAGTWSALALRRGLGWGVQPPVPEGAVRNERSLVQLAGAAAWAYGTQTIGWQQALLTTHAVPACAALATEGALGVPQKGALRPHGAKDACIFCCIPCTCCVSCGCTQEAVPWGGAFRNSARSAALRSTVVLGLHCATGALALGLVLWHDAHGNVPGLVHMAGAALGALVLGWALAVTVLPALAPGREEKWAASNKKRQKQAVAKLVGVGHMLMVQGRAARGAMTPAMTPTPTPAGTAEVEAEVSGGSSDLDAVLLEQANNWVFEQYDGGDEGAAKGEGNGGEGGEDLWPSGASDTSDDVRGGEPGVAEEKKQGEETEAKLPTPELQLKQSLSVMQEARRQLKAMRKRRPAGNLRNLKTPRRGAEGGGGGAAAGEWDGDVRYE